MMKFWAKKTCKKVGHKYGEWVADDTKNGLASKINGWDMFIQKCAHCGDERTVKQHHTVTEMGVGPGDLL